MPYFATWDAETPGREWWRRCRPRIGRTLAAGVLVGVLIGLLIGGVLAVRQVQPDTLILWSKYKFAQGAAAVGLASMQITWPGERGETITSVDEMLKTPGLDSWAALVSQKIGGAALPSLLGGFLAFLATALWSAARDKNDWNVAGRPEPVAAPAPLPVVLPFVQPRVDSPPPPQQETRVEPPPPIITAPVPQPVSPSAQPSAPPPVLSPSPPEARRATPPPSPPATAPVGKPGLSYEAYWGLTELPFENVPDPKFYFPTAMHEEALHRLLYGVQTRKGALLITGEVGSGKTLLSRELSLHLSGQQYDVALIANPSFGTEDFLTEVLYQLGIEPTKSKVKLLHLLNERLLENYKRGKQTVVVIDEAQTIQDDQIFEELRLLLNFQLNDRFLLTLVLIGQPELNDRVMTLKQFAQRISIKYHLGYFSAQQTTEYIQFRMKAVKCGREVFHEDALDIIYKQSGGIPRNINTLCDLCLLIGFMDHAAGVDAKIVERAAAERGQLGLF